MILQSDSIITLTLLSRTPGAWTPLLGSNRLKFNFQSSSISCTKNWRNQETLLALIFYAYFFCSTWSWKSFPPKKRTFSPFSCKISYRCSCQSSRSSPCFSCTKTCSWISWTVSVPRCFAVAWQIGKLSDHDSLNGSTRVIFRFSVLSTWVVIFTSYWMGKTCSFINLHSCICSSVWAAKGWRLPVSRGVTLTWTLGNDMYAACVKFGFSRCLCIPRSPKSVQLLHYRVFSFTCHRDSETH